MKKKFLFVACVSMLSLGYTFTANAADTESGLIGYYTFDDTLANTVSEDGGMAKLHGGAGDTWNSPATGTASYAEGMNGKGYVFTGDVDGNRGEGLELDVTLGNAYTISYWVNAKTVTSYTSMIFSPISLEAGLNITNNWGGTTFPTLRMWGVAGFEDVYLDYWTTSADALCNEWHYITVTCDEEGYLKLYFDAFDADATPETAEQTKAGALNGMPIFLGINFWDISFDGMMDDVAIYNRALTAEDVAKLYKNKGIPLVDTTNIDSNVTTYAQYKKVADNNYTVRLVSEMTLSDIMLTTYNRVGFRCSKLLSNAGDNYLGQKIFKTIKANGETKTAAEGKYFVILEIKDVTADAVLYAQPMYESTSGTNTLGDEVTVNMADILK